MKGTLRKRLHLARLILKPENTEKVNRNGRAKRDKYEKCSQRISRHLGGSSLKKYIIWYIDFNYSIGLLKILTSLDISEVNTLWTWGEQTSPPISKYFNKKWGPSGIRTRDQRLMVQDAIHYTTRAWMKQLTEYF